MADQTGEADLRAEQIDKAIKAIALAEYKLKNLCTVESSNAWIETYYRETNTELTGGGVASPTTVKGVPRGAPFPTGDVSWTKVSGVNEKYAMEGLVLYEDELMNNINVISRTLLKIGRAPAYAVDKQVAAVMLASAGNTFALTAGYEWDAVTVQNIDPVKDLLYAADMLRKDNIDVISEGNGVLCVNGTDYMNLMNAPKVQSNPTFKQNEIVSNGIIASLAGFKILVTEALEATTPDVAYLVQDKVAMTWKEVVPLTVQTIVNPGISKTIRAWELGQCQMVVPNAVCKITNTRK